MLNSNHVEMENLLDVHCRRDFLNFLTSLGAVGRPNPGGIFTEYLKLNFVPLFTALAKFWWPTWPLSNLHLKHFNLNYFSKPLLLHILNQIMISLIPFWPTRIYRAMSSATNRTISFFQMRLRRWTGKCDLLGLVRVRRLCYQHHFGRGEPDGYIMPSISLQHRNLPFHYNIGGDCDTSILYTFLICSYRTYLIRLCNFWGRNTGFKAFPSFVMEQIAIRKLTIQRAPEKSVSSSQR